MPFAYCSYNACIIDLLFSSFVLCFFLHNYVVDLGVAHRGCYHENHFIVGELIAEVLQLFKVFT